VVPSGHHLAGRSSVSLGELASESFVVLGGSFTLSTYVLDACRRAGFEPRVAYEAGGLEMIKGFVRHELGIAILPRLALLAPGDETLVGIPFEHPLTRELNIVRAKDRYATVAARALLVHVRTSMLSTFTAVGTAAGRGRPA
jgi:LysR family transcriptional activator of glutamate synthase operon